MKSPPMLIVLVVSGILAAPIACGDDLGSLEQIYRDLAAKRALHIARLHEYASNAVFPLNTDFPGELVPYFVDLAGTDCAVGHLIRLDGHSSLVASISASNNHVRIAEVRGGPLLEWIRDSGLTQTECALIQPSYAQISDYREGREWQEEITRLQKHFAEVEKTLVSQTDQSLREALIEKVSASSVPLDVIVEASKSSEPNVRIAAGYAVAQVSEHNRSDKLAILRSLLGDEDLGVRFWTAVEVQEVGAASERGKAFLHGLTLPIFLEAAHSSDPNLRLPALIQLAHKAPMTMGTNIQLRIMPEIRRAMVKACEDEHFDISTFARTVLSSWRWQRIVYESQRMRRQYLANSADLEALAAETLALRQEFAEPTDSIKPLTNLRSNFDAANSIIYCLPVATATTVPVARDEAEAWRLVDDYYKTTYASSRAQTESPWPFWKLASIGAHRLYYTVIVQRIDGYPETNMIYVVPRPSMLTSANVPPHSWFEPSREIVPYAGPVPPPRPLHPKADAEIILGELARDRVEDFTVACDLFAHFTTHHSQVVISREVTENPNSLVWSGILASARHQHQNRFFGEGVGSGSIGVGGWDVHRVSFACDRMTGRLSLTATPIEYTGEPIPQAELWPEWTRREFELMGWRLQRTLEYLEGAMLPPEYHQGIAAFNPNDSSKSRNLLLRRYVFERNLPHPDFVLGLLYARAGKRDLAAQIMNGAAGGSRYDPATIARVARWELDAKLPAEARTHAQAALKLWPEHPVALDVMRQLDTQ